MPKTKNTPEKKKPEMNLPPKENKVIKNDLLFEKLITKRKLFYISVPFLLLLLLFLLFQLYFFNRIYPGVSIAGIHIGGLTDTEAVRKIEESVYPRLLKPLALTYQDSTQSGIETYEIALDKESLTIDTKEALSVAKNYGRSKFYFLKVNIPINIALKQNGKDQIEKIAQELNQTAINSQLKFEGGEITVTPSQDGTVLDTTGLVEMIKKYTNKEPLSSSKLPFKKSYPQITYQNALSLKQRLDYIKKEPLKLKFQNQLFNIDLNTAISLLDFNKAQASLISASAFDINTANTSENTEAEKIIDSKLIISEEKLNEFIKNISSQIDRETAEPLFTFDPSQPTRVREFRAPQEGRKLDTKEASIKIESALTDSTIKEVELPVTVIPVKNKFTNDLGIKELIGRGISDFTGSIPNRVFNITLGASRINGVIIAPGDVYSFNDSVGDISAATGFKQGYVIKDGRTVLDDGGGICQVSTTVFRAALNGGFPIVARSAHAYRPVYYERDSGPGFDATIFQPSVDFKFKNDTAHHILIQSYVSGNKIYVDVYGTSDGRVVNTSKSVILNSTPPPPELRQEDPTLPVGTVKQVDWAAWGANVYFTRTVTRNGETLINETIRSNYRPWQAVYLVGTKQEGQPQPTPTPQP